MQSNNPVIRIQQLELGYKPDQKIFNAFSVVAEEGELIALVGRNGMGKSTLLRSIAGLLQPLGGDIQIKGIPISEISNQNKSKLLSFVPAEPVRVPNLEVRNFVAIGRFPYTGWTNGLSESDWKVVDSSLQLVGVQHLASRDITAISDGERQRAMIAFALAQDTKIILLDEPTAFLDLPNKFEMVRLLAHLAATHNKTIIYSTHDLQGAINEADNIWMMLPTGLNSGAPEDLALSKGFEELLANTDVQFDMELGNFRNKKTGTRKIAVKGEGLQLLWTIKMLQRIGFQITDSEREGLLLSCGLENGVPIWSVEENGTQLFQSGNLKDLAKGLRENNYMI